ncbi:MAG TPA: hypothetical protein VLK36_13030 [Gaiellaceae bacterium]|nr:hypothetical protein [Gaiellaceae bacterium]
MVAGRGTMAGESGAARPSAAAFVVLRESRNGTWKLLGEVPRRRGLPARAARSRAILDATGGRAKPGEVYAAVLRSEWRVAQDWAHPGKT